MFYDRKYKQQIHSDNTAMDLQYKSTYSVALDTR